MPFSPQARRRRFLLELLEDRCTPAATAVLAEGLLTISGSAAADVITVRQIDAIIKIDGVPAAFAANQVAGIQILAGAGNDQIFLNSQDVPGQQPLLKPVTVDAGAGDDTVLGGVGAERILGQNGNDSLRGGLGDDTIYGGNGNDRIDGGAGNNLIVGDAGNDSLAGGAGADVIYGGAGNDTLQGGAGNDFLSGGAGRDYLTGGDGIDRYQDDYARPDPSQGALGVLRAIAAKQANDTAWADADDVRQQIANTCSFLSSLSAFAKTSATDLAARVRYDAASDKYMVPLFANQQWTDVAVSFNGTWTDNDPFPNASADGQSRDYWTVLYQRAYLQAMNVNTASTDANQWSVIGTRPDELTRQNWRYANIALQTLTGAPTETRYGLTDSDRDRIESALREGKTLIANTNTFAQYRDLVQGKGLVFAHTYTVAGLGSDANGAYVDLRNPWSVDTRVEFLNGWSGADREFFSRSDLNDGHVRVRWADFQQAFATLVIA